MPALGRKKQANLYELKDSLQYKVISNPVSKRENEIKVQIRKINTVFYHM